MHLYGLGAWGQNRIRRVSAHIEGIAGRTIDEIRDFDGAELQHLAHITKY